MLTCWFSRDRAVAAPDLGRVGDSARDVNAVSRDGRETDHQPSPCCFSVFSINDGEGCMPMAGSLLGEDAGVEGCESGDGSAISGSACSRPSPIFAGRPGTELADSAVWKVLVDSSRPICECAASPFAG